MKRVKWWMPLAVLAALVAASAIGVTSARASSAPASGAAAQPPGGVYTCSWIAQHSAAALLARVTCDPFTAFAQSTLPTFMEPAGGPPPPANGCENVPSSGTVGTGVYAWTGFEYSIKWSWYAHNSPSDYYWYLQTSPGVTYTWGQEFDTSEHESGEPANNYRWGGENESSTSQYWNVCYAD